MPEAAVIFDCEFLSAEGAQRRLWCGPYDPDPLVVQIGAVKLRLAGDFEIEDAFNVYVEPRDRYGRRCAIDPFLTALTGIGDGMIDASGIDLKTALARFADYARGLVLWSWGKDELGMLATSCYVAGITPPIAANRFDNACKLLLHGGMAYEDMQKTPSSGLMALYGLDQGSLRAHDAVDDARSVAFVLQHLLRSGRLTPADFDLS